MKRITSRQNTIVARYKAAAQRERSDPILLDGPHLIRDALDADVALLHLLVAEDARSTPEIAPLVQRAIANDVDLAVGSSPVLDAASPVRSTSGIVALATPPDRGDWMFAHPCPLIAVACDVQDPGNLGAIARVAEASGATGLIAAGASADPFGWKALRGSMGSLLRLPVVTVPESPAAIGIARRHRCRVLAAVPRAGVSLYDTSVQEPVAVLIGSEGLGLSSELIDAADLRVTIPMEAPVESLNAAVAAALIFYEIRRQRS